MTCTLIFGIATSPSFPAAREASVRFPDIRQRLFHARALAVEPVDRVLATKRPASSCSTMTGKWRVLRVRVIRTV